MKAYRENHFPCSGSTAKSFEQVIHRLISENVALSQKELVCEVDCRDVGVPCSFAMQSTLEQMLSLAVERTPRGGEILVTVVDSTQRLEIEVADGGQDEPTLVINALQNLFDSSHQHLTCRPCPQGGLAWTLVLERTLSLHQVA